MTSTSRPEQDLLTRSALQSRTYHHQHDETFTLIEGEMTFVAGDERFSVGPGANWVVPRGVPHTFRVESETAQLVAVFTPAGMEHCFRERAAPPRLRHFLQQTGFLDRLKRSSGR